MDASKSIISFSEDKLKWMEEQLNNADNGYWWQDIWDSESNPYNVDGTHRLSHRKSLYFNKINNCCLKTEMKFAYWQQLVQGKWNMGTLYGGGPYKVQKQFAEFFNQQKCQSFLDKSLEDWLIIFRTFLIDKDYYGAWHLYSASNAISMSSQAQVFILYSLCYNSRPSAIPHQRIQSSVSPIERSRS